MEGGRVKEQLMGRENASYNFLTVSFVVKKIKMSHVRQWQMEKG